MKKTDEGKSEKVDASYFYGYLPKTNCKECGEESCMAFAEKLSNKDTTYEDCPPLLRKRIRDEKKEQRRLLKELKVEEQIYTEEEAYIRATN